MKRRVSRSSGLINQMNVVPYIDVMLVLLIIFMVTAPMFNPGVINLPSVSKSNQITKTPIVVLITSNGFEITANDQKYKLASVTDMVGKVRSVYDGDTSVVVSADKVIEYGRVLSVVDSLYLAGIKQVGLVVKQK